MAAIQRKNLLEAIRLLRQRTGLSLNEASQAIDAYMSGKDVSITVTGAPPGMQAAQPSVTEALMRGDKIEAIKRMREQSGLGLKEAKDAVESMGAGHKLAEQIGGLSPGEVAPSGFNMLWVVVAVVAAGLALWLSR